MTGTEALHHIGITVADLDRSAAFWERLLGTPARDRRTLAGPRLGELVGHPGARIESCWVDLPGGAALELLQHLERPLEPHAPGIAHAGSVHVCLRVADMEQAHARAVECGARPVGGPLEVARGPQTGTRIAYLADPDGVTIELQQPR